MPNFVFDASRNGSDLISLVGMPGAGKTTVGRQLAKRLAWKFADSDAVIESRLNSSILLFFEREGEAAFREIEKSVIDELTSESRMVIATGGGVVLYQDNRDRLHTKCQVVYLRSSPEELFRRLRHDSARPLLQVTDPFARLREMFADRDPLYQKAAHFIVETGRPSVTALVNAVLMQLELSGVIDSSLARSPVEPSKGAS